MKKVWSILFVLCICACDRFLDNLGTGILAEVEIPVERAVYMSGLEYPEGYDWKRDTAYGEVSCTLFLMKNGERILERPAGYAYSTASDEDMHRILNKCLYEDYPSEKETLIYKNGKVLWKWKGVLMVNDMISNGDYIYTLTSPRQGRGCALHRDGETILEIKDGCPVTGLGIDKGKVFFNILDSDGRWKIVHDDNVHAVEPGGWKVRQACLRNGKSLALCEKEGVIGLYNNGKVLEISDISIKFRRLDISVFHENNFTAAGMAESSVTGEKGFCVLNRDSMYWYPMEDFGLCTFLVQDEMTWILGKPDNGDNYAVLHEDNIYELPESCVPAPGNALGIYGGELSVSLTRNGKAVIWTNGELTEYSFNGYIDNIN